MVQLLEQYSLTTIITIVIALALSVKAFVTFFDWGYTKLDEFFKKQHKNDTQDNQIQNLSNEVKNINLENNELKKSIQDLTIAIDKLASSEAEKDKSLTLSIADMKAELMKVSSNQKQMDEQIKLLTDSDREDIKAFLTREHHYFCYQMKWIDNYSLECCEKRYAYYRKENGNSFIENFMEELRKLPKVPPTSIT